MPRRSTSSVFPTAKAVADEIKEAMREVGELRRLHRFLVKMKKTREAKAAMESEPAPAREEISEPMVAPGYDA